MEKEFFELLLKTLQTAKILGIESFLIESDTIRGIDDNKFIFMHSQHNIELDFSSVGVTRADVLYNRLSLLDTSNYTITTTVKNGFLSSFIIKDKKHKLDIKCSNPALIAAPKGIKDAERYQVIMPGDIANVYNKYLTAMKTDNVYLIHDDNLLYFEFTDLNKDTLTCELDANNLQAIDGGNVSKFKYMYDSKSLQLILKNTTNTQITISNRGFIKTNINGISVWLSPKII